MRPPLRSPAFVGCVLLLALAGPAAVAGAPPPTQLCAVCGPADADSSTLGSSITGAPIPGSTGAGTLEIRVDETGDSRWIERVPVDAAAADRYRDDPERLETAVEDAWARYHAAGDDVRDREVEFVAAADDDRTDASGTVVVSYEVADVARSGVGETWLVDYFALGESNHRYGPVAERVTIRPPEGAVVTNEPRYASVDDGAAVWGHDADGNANAFDDQTYVAYGPDDGLAGTASAYATIALEVGPLALEHGALGGAVPAVGVVLAIAAIARFDRGFEDWDVPRLERSLAAVGLAGALAIAVLGLVSGRGYVAPGAVALSALGVGYALLAIVSSRFGDRLETRGLTVVAVAATATVGALTWIVGVRPPYAIPLLFGLSTALCLPMGHGFERGRDSAPVAAVVLAALAPIAAVAAVAPVSVFGSQVVVGVLLLPWVVVVAGFGYPLAILGRRIAARPRSRDVDARSETLTRVDRR